MATISNTPRPGYVWDSTDNVWYPIGVGGHSHPDYITQATAVNPTIIDAKGDIITATAADTPARLAVGNNGETLVADSSASTGLRYQAIQAAGRNVLINADMKINQRGTGLSTTSTTFIVDRFSLNYTGGSCSGEQKLFSPGAGITGLASVEHYLEYISSGQSATTDFLRCRGAFEDIYTFAGETVTFSFYAKAASGTPKIAPAFTQNFGSGGSASVTTKAGEVTISTSWARYSVTFTMPSISGKTIGAGAYNTLQLFLSAGSAIDGGIIGIGVQNNTFQFTALQLEQGSVATPFTTATGTIQGEYSACQRYYWRIPQSSDAMWQGDYWTGTRFLAAIQMPVNMRTTPTFTASGTTSALVYAASASRASTNITAIGGSSAVYVVDFATAAGGTAGQAGRIVPSYTASSWVEWSSEL